MTWIVAIVGGFIGGMLSAAFGDMRRRNRRIRELIDGPR